ICGYGIRTYQGKLWWPLGGDYNYVLHPETFEWRLESGDWDVLVALDPSFVECTEARPLYPFPTEFKPVEEEIPNHRGDRLAAAQRGASRTIYCGEGVFVEAGEPVFYAVPSINDPKCLLLHVGVSDMAREGTEVSFSLPGPSRSLRKEYARRGLALGISELENELCALERRGYRIARRYKINTLLEEHRAETAPLICAQ